METTIGEEVGLRERKKQRTRQAIAETAMRLFRERGFDRVTVAQIARQAEVAEKTVFNYFPTKEDLVYHRMESFEEELIQALRERSPGESILAAFGRFMLRPAGLLDDGLASEDLRSILRMITESPALLARERRVLDRSTDSLAALIREEMGAGADDVRPWVTANALMGVHRALIDHVRLGSLAGRSNRQLAREVRVQGHRALAALERGLAGSLPR